MRLRRRTPKIATTLAALAVAGTSLVGCSTDPADDREAEQTASFSSNEEYQLAFAECMRGEGIDMADPDSSGQRLEAGSGDGFLEAAETCQANLGAPPSGPDSGARPSDEQREIFLQMAQCFRDNGFDVPDPAPGESPSVPLDAPQELFEECAAGGVGGTTGGAP